MIEQAFLPLGLFAVAAPALAGPTEVGERPCYYTADDARRIDFMSAYQAAHKAELGALCVAGNSVVERLKAELEAISRRAQARNPDVNLSTMEGRTGFDICRIPASDVPTSCEKNDADAIANFAAAMTELRNFTKKWR